MQRGSELHESVNHRKPGSHSKTNINEPYQDTYFYLTRWVISDNNQESLGAKQDEPSK